MDVAINSPFRYAGGKFYARKLILEHLQPHRLYLELFAGGGSIFFAKPKAQSNWLNDIDKELVNCYQMIKEKPQALIASLHGEQALKERHTYYKHEFIPQNDLERAQRWFYLNRTSYSGIMNMKNCYWGYGDKYSMRPENWANNILRTSQKLQNVTLRRFWITCQAMTVFFYSLTHRISMLTKTNFIPILSIKKTIIASAAPYCAMLINLIFY
jgi:DNA adenine methylase